MCALLLVLTLAGATAQVESRAEAVASWSASIQVGAGQSEASAAVLVVPRLAARSKHAEVVLAAPLWSPWRERSTAQTVSSWEKPSTWPQMIERLELETADGAGRLFVGTLSHATLGHGVLVDSFTAVSSARSFSTGARSELRLGSFSLDALVDDLVRPALWAGRLELDPLDLLGESRRVGIAAEGAVDVRAPHDSGSSPTGGIALEIDYALWRSDVLKARTYTSGAWLSRPGVGMHFGAELQWIGLENGALSLTAEAVKSSDGYTPGYFDMAYAVERFALFARQWQPKAEQEPDGSWEARLDTMATLGSSELGLSASVPLSGRPAKLAAHLRLQHESWSAAALWAQRDIDDLRDVVRIGPATSAVIEVALRCYERLFLFAQAHRGTRRAPSGNFLPVFDWVVGIGSGLQGKGRSG